MSKQKITALYERLSRDDELQGEGYGPFQIASRLTAYKIEMPAVHMARHGEGLHKSQKIKDPYVWSTSTVVNILKRREYLGHTVNFKTGGTCRRDCRVGKDRQQLRPGQKIGGKVYCSD